MRQANGPRRGVREGRSDRRQEIEPSVAHPADTRFVSIPAWAYDDERITRAMLDVLGALLSFADWDTGVCWPSHATLARTARLSVSTVQRAIRGLRDLGIVHVENRLDEARGKQSNRYIVSRDRPSIARDPSVSAIGHHDRPHRSSRPIPSVTMTDRTRVREQEPGNENHLYGPAGAREATEAQRGYLLDLHLHGGGRSADEIEAWVNGLTAEQADAEIKEALAAIPRGRGYLGDPANPDLSEKGREVAARRLLPPMIRDEVTPDADR